MTGPAGALTPLHLVGERLAYALPAENVPLSPHLRRNIEGAIEVLIALLDAYDGDADLEDDGDDRELDFRDLPLRADGN